MFNFLKSFTTPAKLNNLGIMGMNARNYAVIAKQNKRKLYPLVDDKVKTKELAQEYGICTPMLIGTMTAQHEVKNFLQILGDKKEFVIKPSHGSGGKGVMVITGYDGTNFTTPSGKKISYKDVYQHISNVLSGLYSLGGKYDTALIEELVHFSDIFADYSYQGIPDVRIIVYKGYPIMAMTRLSTSSSAGRANLHQGAVGVGLDIRTGKTLKAVMRNKPILLHPDTQANLFNITVPFWREHLLIASKSFDMTGLGYLGADIVLDAQKGPMMLELNARPGLAIQISNGLGLKNIIQEIDNNYPTNLTSEERVDYILNKKN